MNEKTVYTQQIGTLLNTKQFRKLQTMLEPLNEIERLHVLYNQLKLEIEADEPLDIE